MLVACIEQVANNLTISIQPGNQRSIVLPKGISDYGYVVSEVGKCLKKHNISGTTTFIDIENTADDELMEWASYAVPITEESVRELPIRRLKSELMFAKSYLESGNINMRGYEKGGCDNYMLWQFNNYGVHDNCIDTVSSAITKSLGYD